MTALAVHDVLDEIAGNAAALDQRPAFPHEAFAALRQAGALTPPPARDQEWRLVRDISKADGSVGRIFEGHLNAYERLTLDGIDPGDHLLGVWGADPLPQEGTAASIEGDTLNGEKVFCSGAGGLDRALVIARGELVYVPLDQGVEIDRTWYRAGGMRASESHRVIFDGTPILARAQPADATALPRPRRDAHGGLLGGHPRRGGRGGARRPREQARAGRHPRALRRPDRHRAATIDRWFEYAAHHDGASTQLRQAISDAGRTILDEAARSTGSRPFATGRGWTGRAGTSSSSCSSTGSTRSSRGSARSRWGWRARNDHEWVVRGRERTTAPGLLRRDLRRGPGPLEVRDQRL